MSYQPLNGDSMYSFSGHAETTLEALRLVLAARQGIVSRVTRRLNETERRAIRSGAVFIFDPVESSIKRWTDGLIWSPSRIVGNFLVYREVNDRANSRGCHSNYSEMGPSAGGMGRLGPEPGRPSRSLVEGDHQGAVKKGGLMKKTITVDLVGSSMHVIFYYTAEDITAGRLQHISAYPEIMQLDVAPGLFDLTKFRAPPMLVAGSDGMTRFAPDDNGDDEQTSSPGAEFSDARDSFGQISTRNPRVLFEGDRPPWVGGGERLAEGYQVPAMRNSNQRLERMKMDQGYSDRGYDVDVEDSRFGEPISWKTASSRFAGHFSGTNLPGSLSSSSTSSQHVSQLYSIQRRSYPQTSLPAELSPTYYQPYDDTGASPTDTSARGMPSSFGYDLRMAGDMNAFAPNDFYAEANASSRRQYDASSLCP
ncbi:hypothetical protein PLICRDRAFT_38641 [Plicaturopsis crispa FD-325 SS-3]|nr:hypothetical protein PLICRDRAFT_38641 [Plicaturopsis crispa FD-325 SS-3]